jgi:flagellar protein FlaG
MVHEVMPRTELLATARDPNQNPSQRSAGQDVGVHPSPAGTASNEPSELEKAVARVREVFQSVEPRLQFEIDPDLHRVIVKVMDGESGQVIRQIPPQEVLDLAKNIQASTGLLFRRQA